MSIRVTTSVLPLLRKFALSASAICLSTSFLAVGFAMRVRAQEPPSQTSSVVEAARKARERTVNSGKHPKIITNADLGVQPPAPGASTFSLPAPSANASEGPNLPFAGCDNTQAEGIKAELRATLEELDQLRRYLEYNPPVISGHDLDLQYFRPGNSGLDVGSPPLLDDQPPAPARVREVELEERIDTLQKALRLACEPPEAARIQSTVDEAEQELNLLQRQFALDQDTYYSNPNFVEDTEGKAWLDAEQQQIQSLQSYIERLREDLAAFIPPQMLQ
jgi:hypothetical protein